MEWSGHLEVEFVAEEEPGERWRAMFARRWPHYRRWYLSQGPAGRPTWLECERALKARAPELVPTWERLVELAGGGDVEARFLSQYRPPPALGGCSQAVWHGAQPMLVRNYDHAPRLWDGVVMRTRWNAGAVVSVTDCLFGALDGINEHGLCAALAFGGRREVGDGFSAPLVLRYVLETCATTAEALSALERVPVYMAYNVTLLDALGEHATAWLGPRGVRIQHDEVVTTNHQEEAAWSRHAEITRTLERHEHLSRLVGRDDLDAEAFVRSFQEPPLFANRWRRGVGTLYTAAYSPNRRDVELRWPATSWRQGVDAFVEGRFSLQVPEDGAPEPEPSDDGVVEAEARDARS